MRNPENFPRYDDIWHIDSAAVSKKVPPAFLKEKMGDPEATAYTEMYVEPTNVIEGPNQCEYKR